jgi:hypothetical protein
MGCRKVIIEPWDFLLGALGAGAGIAVTRFAGEKLQEKIKGESKMKALVVPGVGGAVAAGAYFAAKSVPAMAAASFGAGVGGVLTGLHDAAKRIESFKTITDAVAMNGDQSSDPLGDMPLLDMYRAGQTPSNVAQLEDRTIVSMAGAQSSDPLGRIDMDRVEVIDAADLMGAYKDPCAA